MPVPQRHSPYQGLVPYDEEDAPFFFGRERETRLIVANLFAARLTLLYGASGVGKSSILRAAVLHHLHLREDVLVVVFSSWQGNPANNLKAAVAESTAQVSIRELPDAKSTTLAIYLAAVAAQVERRLMIILDQFEEFFLYDRQVNGDHLFDSELPSVVTQADLPVSVLISIREDSLAKLDRFEGRIPTLFDNYLRLDYLDAKAATEAIVKPIEQYNRLLANSEPRYSVEPALVEAVIDQVKIGEVFIGQMGRGQIAAPDRANLQIETPYLQLVMTRLWDEELAQRSSVLRLATLTTLGGAKEIIRTHLDRVMRHLNPAQREVSARIFEYLVTPSGHKVAHTANDLANYAQTPVEQVRTVVSRLSQPDIRILRSMTTGIAEQAESRYEIFHDALAPAVLDWRSRHFNRGALFERFTVAAIYFVLAVVVIQSLFPMPPVLLALLRAVALIILNSIVLLQMYRWFYRYTGLTITTLPVLHLGGSNLGILVGALLAILWYVCTKWPLDADPGNPLGTIAPIEFMQYMFVVMPTLLFGLAIFLVMQFVGKWTHRLFGRFDVGFYGVYLAACLLIIASIFLVIGRLLPRWISF